MVDHALVGHPHISEAGRADIALNAMSYHQQPADPLHQEVIQAHVYYESQETCYEILYTGC